MMNGEPSVADVAPTWRADKPPAHVAAPSREVPRPAAFTRPTQDRVPEVNGILNSNPKKLLNFQKREFTRDFTRDKPVPELKSENESEWRKGAPPNLQIPRTTPAPNAVPTISKPVAAPPQRSGPPPTLAPARDPAAVNTEADKVSTRRANAGAAPTAPREPLPPPTAAPPTIPRDPQRQTASEFQPSQGGTQRNIRDEPGGASGAHLTTTRPQQSSAENSPPNQQWACSLL